MLKDQVILITGAGKGIGEAVVQELLFRKNEFPDLKLFLTSRTKSELETLTTLASKANVECEYLVSDLSDRPLDSLNACVQKYGKVDALIHCAGVGRFGDFLHLTADDLRFVMKSNVEAAFLLMQATYAQMKKQSSTKLRGQIQWITSIAAEKPFPQSAIYCMSKYAQRGLIDVMRSYAQQDGIRILDVKPGATLTPMWGEVTGEMKSKMMSARDIANPMVNALLLAPEASLEELTIRPIGGDL